MTEPVISVRVYGVAAPDFTASPDAITRQSFADREMPRDRYDEWRAVWPAAAAKARERVAARGLISRPEHGVGGRMASGTTQVNGLRSNRVRS